MTSTAILYPALVMFLMTIVCIFMLGVSRRKAVQERRMNAGFYRTYNKGEEPDDLRIKTRHVQNHFEVPPLFYMGVVICYITNSVSAVTLGLAWAFVISRMVHTFVHLNGNNVNLRFMSYGIGLMILTAFWLVTFVGLI